MDNTVSASKGCFTFKPKDDAKKSNKRKKNDIWHDPLDFSSTYWYKSYFKLWKHIEKKLEKINKDLSDIVLQDLESFISGCNVLTKPIHTAVLLTGVNLPDHNALFNSLASRVQNSVTPHVALLQSEDCSTVRSTIELMVGQLIKGTKVRSDEDVEMGFESDSDEDEVTIKRSDCSLLTLLNWYNENNKEKDRNIQNFPDKLVIILKDFEGFLPKILEDFILILSQYTDRLPIVLVMGVATTVNALHRTLPHVVTSQLNFFLFQSKPSVYFLNNTLDNVFLKTDCPFQLGSKIFKFLTDVFLYYDFSVDGFIKGIKYCLMDHFYSSPTSILCCLQTDINNIIDSMSNEHINHFQETASFKSYFNKLSKQKQIKISSHNNAMKDLLKTLMQELWEHVSVFHLFIRLLKILVADLPGAPLGKQVREIYSEAVSNNVTKSTSYDECFKILGLTAKDELVFKLNRLINVLENASLNSNSKVNTILNRLKELTTNVENVGLEPINSNRIKSPAKEKFNLINRAQFKEHLEKLSKSKIPKNAYEAARADVLDYLKDEVFEKILHPVTSMPLHEVILFDNINSVKRHIIGTPRAAVHTALNNPHHYLQCECCQLTTESEILPTMPDVCIAYKLHLESGSLINMYDWLQSFATIVDPENAFKNDQKDIDAHVQARFTQAVAELQFLGFIKSSKKKLDHVTRLTWGGSA